jgi:hypothetical protein
MNKNFLRGLVGTLIGVMCSAIVFAQDARMISAAGDKYVISAKAGGVNFVEGDATVVRKSGRGGYLLKGDQLEIGDKVSTGATGKVELLLNPGSYVRLGSNSSFEFTTTSLDDLRLKLNKGNAIFEVFADEEFKVSINTPKAKIFLIESGVYRVDVLGDGSGRVSVSKGRAQVGDIDSTVVKKGRQATVNGSQVDIVKYDTDTRDEIDLWSRDRAKELARISTQVRRTSMRNSLMSSFYGNGTGFGWNIYNSFGLWAYDPFWRSFCFLPFGYGWNSPYGYGFGPNLYWYNLPPIVYMPTYSNGNGGGGSTPTQVGIRDPGHKPPVGLDTPTRAPYTKIQDDVGTSRGRGREVQDNSTFDMSTPSYSPPITSVPSSGGGGTTRDSGGGSKSSNPGTKDQ